MQVKGTATDLQQVTQWVEAFGYSIAVEGGDHMMRSDTFAALDDAREIRNSATHFLEKINRAARQRSPHDYSGVEVGRVIQRGQQGVMHHVFVADTVRLTVRMDAVIVANGTIMRRDRPSVPEIMKIVERNAELEKALNYVQTNPTWAGYFMAFEVIEKVLGGRQGIWAKRWATKDDVAKFAISAQQGRHHEPNAAHSEPFTEQDGGRFVRELLDRWIEEERSIASNLL